MKASHYLAVALLLTGCVHASRPTQIDPPMPEALNRIRLVSTGPVVIIGHNRTKNLDTIQLQGNAVEPAAICTKFDASRDGSESVVIKAAPDASYGTVLLVISAAQTAGFIRFGFANKVRGVATDPGAPAGFDKLMPKPTPRPIGLHIDYPHLIQVEASNSNRVWINGRRTNPRSLYKDLARVIAFHASHRAEGYTTSIWLFADAATKWDTIIRILDAGHQAGDDDVELRPPTLRNGEPVIECPG